MPGKAKKPRKGKPVPRSKVEHDRHESRNSAPTRSTNVTYPKRTSMLDEAFNVSKRGSKRLWQGETTKFRNLPVEFIQGVGLASEDCKQRIEAVQEESLGDSTSPSPPIQGVAVPAAPELTHIVIDSDSDDQVPPEPLSYPTMNDHVVQPDIGGLSVTMEIEPTDIIGQIDSLAINKEQTDFAIRDPAGPIENLISTDGNNSAESLEIDFGKDTAESPVNFDALMDHLQASSSSQLASQSDLSSEGEEAMQLYINDLVGDQRLRPKNLEFFHDYGSSDENLGDNDESSIHTEQLVGRSPWACVIDDPVGQIDSINEAQSHSVSGEQLAGRDGADKSRHPTSTSHDTRSNARRHQRELMDDYIQNMAMQMDETDDSDVESVTEMAGPVLLSENVYASEVSLSEGSDSEESGDEIVATDDSEDDSDFDDELQLMIDAAAEEQSFQSFRLREPVSDDSELDDSILRALEHDQSESYDFENLIYKKSVKRQSAKQHKAFDGFLASLDLSDEELAADLISQWEADKAAKKSKKRNRQKMHIEGLIGKKAKKARASHDIGGSALELHHQQIVRFVTHKEYVGIFELPLQTMDKVTRKAVHLISQAYGLKSSSQGTGKRRHITLYKTKHSMQLPDPVFLESVLYRSKKMLGVNSKYKKSQDADGAHVPSPRSRGSRGKAGASQGRSGGGSRLRDGDIVGADAPELDSRNRGRLMLEKLGWLHGSGLGAVGAGIAVPIFATIKNSKIGLG